MAGEQPKRPRRRKSSAQVKTTGQAISDIESMLGNQPVLVYIQDVAIGPWDVLPIFSLLSEIGKVDTLNLIIDCDGGYADDAYKIASVLREYCKHLVVIVPFKAKSAATILSLAGDKILMSPLAELGPCDPMINVDESLVTPAGIPVRTPVVEEDSPRRKKRQINALALRDFLEISGILQKNDRDEVIGYDCDKLLPFCEKGILNPWLLGDFERSIKQSHQWAENLLKRYMFKDDIDSDNTVTEIAQKLTEGYYYHGYPLGRREAQELKLKVEDMPDNLWASTSELMAAYDIMKKEQNLITIIETSRSYRINKRPE
jgi:hypothetical protein